MGALEAAGGVVKAFSFESVLAGTAPTVLCLGAHCDDVEIGCGGTLLEIARRVPAVRFVWATFSSDDVRRQESERCARSLLGERVTTRYWTFRDGFFPYLGGEVKDAFEQLKREIAPDLVFTHARDDAHQDHRMVAELTGNTWRNHLVLHYEIPKYDADLTSPNVFVELEEEAAATKVRAVLEAYASQRGKQWLDEDTLRGLMRIRGVECASSTRLAEGFHCRKIVVG